MLRLAVQPFGFPERLRKVLEVVIAQAFVVDWQLCIWSEREARSIDVLVQLVGDRWPEGMAVALPDKAPRLHAQLRIGDIDQFRQAPFTIGRHSLFSQLVAALVAIGESVRAHPQRNAAAESASALALSTSIPARTEVRVALVVEESQAARMQIAAELNSLGFQSQAFADAAEALAYARGHAVSLAVIETELTGPIDGITLCRRLRETSIVPISVLMLTNHGGTLERLRALVNGSHAYLTKPVDRLMFRTEVQRLLSDHEHDAEAPH